MKILIITTLTLLAAFAVWKLIIIRASVAQTNLPISNSPSSILEQCIIKLNSSEKLCLSDFKGKKILIVNVASQCGYTKQYTDLEKLYQTYKDNLIILGFPCNQFGGQESGSEDEIEKFCSSKYSVSFPMTTKVDVKGDKQHAIYKWLTTKNLNGIDDYKVNWNFNKFLIDENGQLIGYFSSQINPMDSVITKLLK